VWKVGITKAKILVRAEEALWKIVASPSCAFVGMRSKWGATYVYDNQNNKMMKLYFDKNVILDIQHQHFIS
jgi:hypothetical protein